jgi:hypothetical protein
MSIFEIEIEIEIDKCISTVFEIEIEIDKGRSTVHEILIKIYKFININVKPSQNRHVIHLTAGFCCTAY